MIRPVFSSLKNTALFAVLLLALALRVGWALHGPRSDALDTKAYLASAKSLFTTGQMSSELYMPLYPILLQLSGSGILAIQIVLSVLSVAMVYWLAQRLWSSFMAGLIAALLCAVHPMLIYYANLRLTETTYIFLVLFSLVLLYRQQFLATSITLVAATLVRPSLDLVAPLMIGAAAYAIRRSWGDVARGLGTYAVVYLMLMMPWWLHNYKFYDGQFVRLDMADGVTMVLENNISFENGNPDDIWSTFRESDFVSRNNAMKRAAVLYIIDRPSHWLMGSVDKGRVASSRHGQLGRCIQLRRLFRPLQYCRLC